MTRLEKLIDVALALTIADTEHLALSHHAGKADAIIRECEMLDARATSLDIMAPTPWANRLTVVHDVNASTLASGIQGATAAIAAYAGRTSQ